MELTKNMRQYVKKICHKYVSKRKKAIICQKHFNLNGNKEQNEGKLTATILMYK